MDELLETKEQMSIRFGIREDSLTYYASKRSDIFPASRGYLSEGWHVRKKLYPVKEFKEALEKVGFYFGDKQGLINAAESARLLGVCEGHIYCLRMRDRKFPKPVNQGQFQGVELLFKREEMEAYHKQRNKLTTKKEKPVKVEKIIQPKGYERFDNRLCTEFLTGKKVEYKGNAKLNW